MALNVEPDRISMVSVGGQLKAAREKRGLSLDQAQKQTRIYSSVLLSLEEGRCDDMLTAVYVKGFLKKYADFLGLDSRTLLKEYDVLHQSPRHGAEAPAQVRENAGSPVLRPKTSIKLRTISSSGMLRRLGFAVLIILALLLVVNTGRKMAKRASTARKQPASAASKTKPAQEASRKAHSVKSQPAPESALEVPKNAPLKLELYVKKPLTVKVKVDGTLRFGRYLVKGTRESLTAKESINIYASKAENLELTLNGEALPIAAKGLVKDIEITRKGVRIK